MNTATITVSIVGSPIACAEGVKETWRELADWSAAQLRTRYGDQVEVTYYDLFDPACPPLPAGGQLPLVLVNGETVISGGKLAMPVIRQQLEALGVQRGPTQRQAEIRPCLLLSAAANICPPSPPWTVN